MKKKCLKNVYPIIMIHLKNIKKEEISTKVGKKRL